MKTLLIITSLITLFYTNTANANNELKLTFTLNNNISLTKIDANTIQINTMLSIGSMETIFIERSYNNKSFQEVAVLMNDENNKALQSIVLKNKVKTNAKKVYYRVIKINKDNTSSIIANSTLQLK